MRHCIEEVQETINDLGGLGDEGLVPRVFYHQGNQSVQQLSMSTSDPQRCTSNPVSAKIGRQFIAPYRLSSCLLQVGGEVDFGVLLSVEVGSLCNKRGF
jgi:hypothetical protein